MQQIATTRRRDMLLQQIVSCDVWKSLWLLQNFVAAICRTSLNSCDISQRQNKRKQPCRSVCTYLRQESATKFKSTHDEGG